MTDNEIIYNYLDKYYTLTYCYNQIYILDLVSNQNKNAKEFTIDFFKIFGDVYADGSIRTYDIGAEWLRIKKLTFTKKIDDILNRCVVELGRTNWIIKYEGKLITEKSLMLMVKDIYDESFFKVHFDEWFNEKVLDLSSKMISQ